MSELYFEIGNPRDVKHRLGVHRVVHRASGPGLDSKHAMGADHKFRLVSYLDSNLSSGERADSRLKLVHNEMPVLAWADRVDPEGEFVGDLHRLLAREVGLGESDGYWAVRSGSSVWNRASGN